MPLPKTSTIAARATEAYAEAWSAVLQTCWNLPPLREDDLSDLSQLLPYLRQLLTCCACAGLLEEAMVSLSCGHCYCSACQFRPPLLKIQCRQCRERSGLVIESQLRLVVKGYKHMCFILADHFRQNPSLPGLGGVVSECDPIAEILREVEKGEKVSRSVLIVKPPEKYLKPPSSSTPKKDPSSKPSTSFDSEELEDVSLSHTPVSRSHKSKKHERRSKNPSHQKKKKSSRVRSNADRPTSQLVPVDSIGTSSDEEVDILNLGDSDSSEPISLKVSIPSFHARNLQVDISCFDKACVSVSKSVVQVRPLLTQLQHQSPVVPFDRTLPSSAVLVGSSSHRSVNPFCPRVLRRPNCQEQKKQSSLKAIFSSGYRDFPKPRRRLTKPKKPRDKSEKKTDKSSPPSNSKESAALSPAPSPVDESPSAAKKMKVLDFSLEEKPPRCRCGTNYPQFLENICARNKCPCYSRAMPCTQCLCRHCHNPFND